MAKLIEYHFDKTKNIITDVERGFSFKAEDDLVVDIYRTSQYYMVQHAFAFAADLYFYDLSGKLLARIDMNGHREFLFVDNYVILFSDKIRVYDLESNFKLLFNDYLQGKFREVFIYGKKIYTIIDDAGIAKIVEIKFNKLTEVFDIIYDVSNMADKFVIDKYIRFKCSDAYTAYNYELFDAGNTLIGYISYIDDNCCVFYDEDGNLMMLKNDETITKICDKYNKGDAIKKIFQAEELDYEDRFPGLKFSD